MQVRGGFTPTAKRRELAVNSSSTEVSSELEEFTDDRIHHTPDLPPCPRPSACSPARTVVIRATRWLTARSPAACCGTSITTATALASTSMRRSTALSTHRATALAIIRSGYASVAWVTADELGEAQARQRIRLGVGGLPDGFTTMEPPPIGGGRGFCHEFVTRHPWAL